MMIEHRGKRIFEVVKKMKRVSWNKQQDLQLIKLVKEYGEKRWSKIAAIMQEMFEEPLLTQKKCRERWWNCINPKYAKGLLNETEVLLLLSYYSENRNKWVMISERFGNRSPIQLKNEFSFILQKTAHKIIFGNAHETKGIFAYITDLYIAALLHDVLDIDNKIDYRNYLYKHIMESSLTQAQCLAYVCASSKYLALHFDGRINLYDLMNLNQIACIKLFLQKLSVKIKTLLNFKNHLSEKDLLNNVESLLSEGFTNSSLYLSQTNNLQENLSTPQTSFIETKEELNDIKSIYNGEDVSFEEINKASEQIQIAICPESKFHLGRMGTKDIEDNLWSYWDLKEFDLSFDEEEQEIGNGIGAKPLL